MILKMIFFQCGLFSYRNSSTKLHPLDTRLSVALQAYDAARMLDAVQKVCGKEGGEFFKEPILTFCHVEFILKSKIKIYLHIRCLLLHLRAISREVFKNSIHNMN